MLDNVAEHPISDNAIEVRVDNIAQLFDTLDPFPFPERDLDRDAEDYIVGWARELDPNKTIRIIIHFPDNPTEVKAAAHVSEAFARYFHYRAGVIQRGPSMTNDAKRPRQPLEVLGFLTNYPFFAMLAGPRHEVERCN